MKTIRIKYPDWQAGNNPVYYFGADLLSKIIPENAEHEEITIDIEKPTHQKLELEHGIVGRSFIEQNIRRADQAINHANPDRIITIGGDCLVSQVSFDYLHGKYKNELGVIWIDAHPDISNPKLFYNAHAMVVANLLHVGDEELSKLVKHPFKPNNILYLGVQEPTLDEKAILNDLQLDFDGVKQNEDIKNWLERNQFKKVVIHLDLDVLDPSVFHSIYFNDPNLGKLPENAAIGKMSLKELSDYLKFICNITEVVGFNVTEYLPWDAYYLRNLFNGLTIFKE